MTLRGISAVLLCVAILFVAPVTVVQALLEGNAGGLAPSEELRNWAQAVQGVATVLAIAIGGCWMINSWRRGSEA